jgi:hypothetical protein
MVGQQQQYVPAPVMALMQQQQQQPRYEIAPDFYLVPRDVRRQLFAEDPATKGSVLGLRYPPTPDAQRDVINKYVQHHRIAREEMLDFWMQYVDCLLCIPAFEDKYSPEFRAWAYGRLARYLLMRRREATDAQAYDPLCNPVLQSDLAKMCPAQSRSSRSATADPRTAARNELSEWSPPRTKQAT